LQVEAAVTDKLRIAVVGYGIAGTSASIALRRLGHKVHRFERAGPRGAGGAGLLLNAAGLGALTRLGMRSAMAALGAKVSRVYGATVGGSRIMDLDYEAYFPGNHALGVQRAALLDALRAVDEQETELQFAEITGANATQGYLLDEKRTRLGPFDLIVAADGANSTLRVGLKGLIQSDRLYRSAAIVCLIDDPNRHFKDRVLQYFSSGSHIAIWPVGSRAPGAPHRINVSVNVPIAEADHLRVPAVWRRHVAKFCPAIVPLLEQADGTIDLLLFTYRDVALRRYYAGRLALIGDAAHSMSPQLGQGATMALLDSQALARALEGTADIASALTKFDRMRRSAILRCQRISRWVTPIFQSASPALAFLRDSAFYPASRLPYVKSSMLKTLSGM
jgi:2-polyprenyl-6-methoxyphenol hydroxylase-like FAD-dependent oxidoreductase